MSILVVADHDNKQLGSGCASVVNAASQLGGDVHILVVGSGCSAVAEQAAKLAGVAKILKVDNAAYEHQLAEDIAPLVASLQESGGYGYIMTAATTTGKDFLPRVAVLLDVAQISDVIKIESADTFVHPIYAGNALETVTVSDSVKLLTIRPTAFDRAAVGGNAAIEDIAALGSSGLSHFVSAEMNSSDRPELASANIVISGGRGVGSKENFAIIEALADKLGAAIGASRAAVDAGYISNDYQVGQTGKVVAPDLYIAVGISGAIQHLAGMKDSKVIVAINKDENAPIFDVADYGLVADLFDAVPELTSTL